MRIFSRSSLLLLLLAVPILVCATTPALCGTLEEKIERYFETGPEPEVVIRSFNGSVEIRETDKNRVHVVLTKHVFRLTGLGAEHALDSIGVKMSKEGDRIVLEATGPHHRTFLKCTGAIMQVEVPVRSRVYAETTNGAIESEGLRAYQNLRTTNAAIEVEDSSGVVELETKNGPIEVEIEDGSLQCKTTNSKISVESDRSDLEIETSNGSIDVEIEGGSVRAQTSSGKIVVDGSAERADLESSNGAIIIDQGLTPVHVHARTSNGKIEFEGRPKAVSLLQTSNGPIRVDIPEDAELWLEASTSNGRVDANVDFDEVKRRESRRVEGRMGSNPSARLILKTSNGPIDIDLN